MTNFFVLMQADAESAMLATIAWLRACNAVVLPQGGVWLLLVLLCVH